MTGKEKKKGTVWILQDGVHEEIMLANITEQEKYKSHSG